MGDLGCAALFVVLAWWLSTGVVLVSSTHRASLVGATALAIAGLGALWWSSGVESRAAAYAGFAGALAVWAWHELSFLHGVVTGPRKEPCPPDARGWRRFAFATATLIHHEVALAATALGVALLTWGGPNQVGTWTFLVLWTMRLSAKLNVFLGVRNLAIEWIPGHLAYLASYVRRARLNPLMPLSLAAGGVVLFALLGDALAGDATAFEQVGRTLVATILGLAVLEHLFLALPIPDAILWRWALRRRDCSPPR